MDTSGSAIQYPASVTILLRRPKPTAKTLIGFWEHKQEKKLINEEFGSLKRIGSMIILDRSGSMR